MVLILGKSDWETKTNMKVKNKNLVKLLKDIDGFIYQFTDYHEAEGLDDFLKVATGKKYYISELHTLYYYTFVFHTKRNAKVIKKIIRVLNESEK